MIKCEALNTLNCKIFPACHYDRKEDAHCTINFIR